MLAAAATGSPVKSQHNPFRHSADAASLNAPDISPQTDLDIHPTSLERSPSPVEAPSPSTSPEPSQESPNTPTVPDTPRIHEETSTPRPMYAPPPGSPPRHSLEVAITEELPPAYTPTADVRQGETSVEFGPRRPFGNAPAQPYAVRQAPQRPSWQPLGTGNPGWSGYPGTGTVRRPPPGAPLIHIDPPPQHPRLQRSVSPNGGSVRVPRVPQRPLSDFARDFYTAGAGQGGAREGASEGANGQNGSPVSPQDRPRSPPIVDDGRPTKKPVPGHPLLNSGKVLVYPAGYECPKCHNTGYKHFDPSNPCTKCWSKYAKAYAGPLTYTPWTSSPNASSSSQAGHNLQRPLPLSSSASAHPYSRSLTDLAASGSPPHPDLGRSASTSRQYAGYSSPSPYAQARATSPAASGGWPPASWTSSSSSPTRLYGDRPPPGSTIVQPGDPRIGGRLCWRCGGSGVTSLFIFDEQTCNVCNGLGRTF